jgi:valyl-tRNA synthetase
MKILPQQVENVSVDGRTRRAVPGYDSPVEFGVMSSFAYPLENGSGEIVVSTTRLESMLGDCAVAVHPDDPRYSNLIGQRVRHPLSGKLLWIIADSFVDRDFGSGEIIFCIYFNLHDIMLISLVSS